MEPVAAVGFFGVSFVAFVVGIGLSRGHPGVVRAAERVGLGRGVVEPRDWRVRANYCGFAGVACFLVAVGLLTW